LAEITLDNIVLLLSYTIGYLIINSIDNVFLQIYKKGTKFRWSLNPFKPFLKPKTARILAVLQFSIPFILAFFIDELIHNILDKTTNYLIPIFMFTIASYYLSSIQALPYKRQTKLPNPHLFVILGVYLIGVLIIFLIHTQNPLYCYFVKCD
jgi:hypothetical protein